MFGSSLPPVVCGRVGVLFTLFMCVLVLWCPTHRRVNLIMIHVDFCRNGDMRGQSLGS